MKAQVKAQGFSEPPSCPTSPELSVLSPGRAHAPPPQGRDCPDAEGLLTELPPSTLAISGAVTIMIHLLICELLTFA